MNPEKEDRRPRSRAELLDLMRRRDITGWQSLCDYLGMSLSGLCETNQGGWWMHQVEILRSCGFLRIEKDDSLSPVADGEPYFPRELEGRFVVTDLWRDVQAALEIGLSDIANMNREGSTVMRPVFGPPGEDHAHDVFVLMPFSEDLEPVYTDHILKVTDKLDLSTKRADDLYSPTFIVRDIWNSINSAKVIIADCTGRNPNVFYELGIAHTVGKSPIILTQDDQIPFDINYVRLIKYQYTPRGMEKFEQYLERYLGYVLGRCT
ncbi:MAG: hypothetical protein AABO57_25625 [Acidobacteriota bacterium]